MFKFHCPSCQTALTATNELGGQVVQCTSCRSSITVPQPPNPSPPVPVVSVLPSLSMLSPNLAMILSSGKGKYWYWTKRLDADNLEALLWVIGEFGSRFAAANFPEPHFYRHSMAEDRMRNALRILAKIQSVGRVQLNDGPFMRSGWQPFELSEQASAFSLEYRARLSKDAHTAWAQGLDERNFGILLWMIGEYGVRVNSSRGADGGDYPPPSFDADPDCTKPMRAALRLMAKIERGEPMTTTEASRHIAENED